MHGLWNWTYIAYPLEMYESCPVPSKTGVRMSRKDQDNHVSSSLELFSLDMETIYNILSPDEATNQSCLPPSSPHHHHFRIHEKARVVASLFLKIHTFGQRRATKSIFVEETKKGNRDPSRWTVALSQVIINPLAHDTYFNILVPLTRQ